MKKFSILYFLSFLILSMQTIHAADKVQDTADAPFSISKFMNTIDIPGFPPREDGLQKRQLTFNDLCVLMGTPHSFSPYMDTCTVAKLYTFTYIMENQIKALSMHQSVKDYVQSFVNDLQENWSILGLYKLYSLRLFLSVNPNSDQFKTHLHKFIEDCKTSTLGLSADGTLIQNLTAHNYTEEANLLKASLPANVKKLNQ